MVEGLCAIPLFPDFLTSPRHNQFVYAFHVDILQRDERDEISRNRERRERLGDRFSFGITIRAVSLEHVEGASRLESHSTENPRSRGKRWADASRMRSRRPVDERILSNRSAGET